MGFFSFHLGISLGLACISISAYSSPKINHIFWRTKTKNETKKRFYEPKDAFIVNSVKSVGYICEPEKGLGILQ